MLFSLRTFCHRVKEIVADTWRMCRHLGEYRDLSCRLVSQNHQEGLRESTAPFQADATIYSAFSYLEMNRWLSVGYWKLPNNLVQGATLRNYSRKVPGPISDWRNYPVWYLSLFCRDCTLSQTTTVSFHILSTSYSLSPNHLLLHFLSYWQRKAVP
jgi:hypothetical protein